MSGTKATNPAIRPPAESTRPPSLNPREIGEDSSGSCMWQRRSWGSSSRWGMRALLLAGGRSSSSGGRRQGSRTLLRVLAPGMARGSEGCCSRCTTPRTATSSGWLGRTTVRIPTRWHRNSGASQVLLGNEEGEGGCTGGDARQIVGATSAWTSLANGRQPNPWSQAKRPIWLAVA